MKAQSEGTAKDHASFMRTMYLCSIAFALFFLVVASFELRDVIIRKLNPTEAKIYLWYEIVFSFMFSLCLIIIVKQCENLLGYRRKFIEKRFKEYQDSDPNEAGYVTIDLKVILYAIGVCVLTAGVVLFLEFGLSLIMKGVGS